MYRIYTLFLKRKTSKGFIYFIELCKNYHIIENSFQSINIIIIFLLLIESQTWKTLQFT